VFTKGGGQWLEAIADIGCDAVGLDWTSDLGEARGVSVIVLHCKAISTRWHCSRLRTRSRRKRGACSIVSALTPRWK